jgi:hypothetical protein
MFHHQIMKFPIMIMGGIRNRIQTALYRLLAELGVVDKHAGPCNEATAQQQQTNQNFSHKLLVFIAKPGVLGRKPIITQSQVQLLPQNHHSCL